MTCYWYFTICRQNWLPLKGILVHTFKAQSHPLTIYGCGFVCTPDNVKLITVRLTHFTVIMLILEEEC